MSDETQEFYSRVGKALPVIEDIPGPVDSEFCDMLVEYCRKTNQTFEAYKDPEGYLILEFDDGQICRVV